MRPKLRRKLFILVIIALFLLHQFSFMQQVTARLSTSTYVKIKYSDRNLEFKHVEYSPQFGNYFVSFEDKNRETFSVEVAPKFIPVIIIYDPLDPGP